MLIIFGGLPGTGKTAITRELARRFAAVYLRIDSIEQAIRAVDDLGYRAAYAIPEDNLRLGRTVIADCVNPLALTRDAWLEVAKRAQADAVEIEITCSDAFEHRRRVEERATGPSWAQVVSREYHPWRREHIVIDTAGRSAEECVALVSEAIIGR